jgi:hypothetical protein
MVKRTAIADPNQLSRHERRLVDQIHAERLEELAGRAERLSRNAGLAQLAELAADLHGMARDIESA